MPRKDLQKKPADEGVGSPRPCKNMEDYQPTQPTIYQSDKGWLYVFFWRLAG